MKASRNPWLFQACGIPDTLTGRFEAICIHVFLLIDRMNDDVEATHELSQNLFDAMFTDMDQSLRQIGIGDMGIPKRMRHMMKSLNGRSHAYTKAFEGKERIEEALKRNVYATAEEVSNDEINLLAEYLFKVRDKIKKVSIDDLMNGDFQYEQVT